MRLEETNISVYGALQLQPHVQLHPQVEHTTFEDSTIEDCLQGQLQPLPQTDM